MLVTFPFQVFAGVSVAIQGVYRGSGLQNMGARLNFVSYLAVAIPVGLVLAYQLDFGLVGLWLGLCCGFVCNAVYGLYWLYRANWAAMAFDAQRRTRDPSEISPEGPSLC